MFNCLTFTPAEHIKLGQQGPATAAANHSTRCCSTDLQCTVATTAATTDCEGQHQRSESGHPPGTDHIRGSGEPVPDGQH